MMKIGIVILNYNKKDLLEKCLESVFNLAHDNYKIIVVDNGSSDGSIEMVEKTFPEADILKMGYNSGFCRGNNFGIRRAFELGCEGVTVLNNDTIVDQGFLRAIVGIIDRNKNIGMVSTNILLFNQPEVIDANGFMITPDGIGKNLNAGKPRDSGNASREVFCPTGASTFFLKEVLEDVVQDGQYFDEDFEFNYEELDLGWRARLRGWKCFYAPEAIVYHHKSATGGAFSELFTYCSSRNLYFNIIKNYPSTPRMLKAIVLSFLRNFFLFFGFFIGKGIGNRIKEKNGIFSTIGIFIRSLKDAAMKMPKMLKKRKYIQSRKKVDQKEVKRWFKELGYPFLKSVYMI